MSLMAISEAKLEKPERWDVPFAGPPGSPGAMTDDDVDRVMGTQPFAGMDESNFSAAQPLRGIIQNDMRLVKYQDGDIVVREGDYGHSAFLIVSGQVRVTLESLPPRLLGRKERKRRGFFEALSQLWSNSRNIESRDVEAYAQAKSTTGQRGSGEHTHVYLQDVPGIIGKYNTVTLQDGEMFGEIAAMGRIPRTATVFAEGDVELLEIRWQGLRDIRKRDEGLKAHTDELYRRNTLDKALRASSLFDHLSDTELHEVAEKTEFETHGSFEWSAQFKKAAQKDLKAMLKTEPIVAEEGHYPNGLIIVRSGFCRISVKQGNGIRTLSYGGAGQTYGMKEMAHNWRTGEQLPLQTTLRALGYVDILRIPTPVVEEYILKRRSEDELPPLIKPQVQEPAEAKSIALPVAGAQSAAQGKRIDDGMLEYLVENRLINGTQTMVIDLDRCTRCDDCIRACASAHDNNPRFLRHGPQYGNYMVANACMHCTDPVCMIGCPTGAIGRDETGGMVIINDTTCVGCATCANACPYSNIRMVEIRDDKGGLILDQNKAPVVKATKCDLCADQPTGPNCERACPHDALKRIDMRDKVTFGKWLHRHD